MLRSPGTRVALAALVAASVVAGCGRDEPPAPPAQLTLTGMRQIGDAHLDQFTSARWAGPHAVVFTGDEGGGLYIADTGGGGNRLLGRLAAGTGTTIASDRAGATVASLVNLRYQTVVQQFDRAGAGMRTQLGPPDVTTTAIDESGSRLAVLGLDLTVLDLDRAGVVSTGIRPATDDVYYQSAVFAGKYVVAYASGMGFVDRWDVSAGGAVLSRQTCGCDVNDMSLDPDATHAAFTTTRGEVGLWDIATGRPVARKRVTDPSIALAQPRGVVDGRVVLYTAYNLSVATSPDPNAGGDALYAWDTSTGTTAAIWRCPHCYIGDLRRQPDTGQLLIKAGTLPDDHTQLWVAATSWS
jgi:hypothetical protein